MPPVERAEFEKHIRTCPACAADALVRLQLKRATQSAARSFTPSPEFRLKIERSVQGKHRHWTKVWAPAFAAVVVGLMLISAVVWMRSSRGEQALSELADLHVATLASAHPVDVVSSDRHTVKPWFQGRIPFSFNLPELQGSAFTLTGGRVVYFQQNAGAQLIFETRKHQISVFIFQNRDELASGSPIRRKLDFNSETWTEDGLRYFILGDASPADIHDLSGRLKRVY